MTSALTIAPLCSETFMLCKLVSHSFLSMLPFAPNARSCPCLFDGFSGPLCDEVTECMCVNQCSGHGECDSGFCKCHPGWYGTDCARRAAGLPVEPGAEALVEA